MSRPQAMPPPPTQVPLQTPEAPASRRILGDIPGIESEGLIESLRRSGLACVSAIRGRGLSWTCSVSTRGGLEYLVAFSGPGTDSLDALSATIEQHKGAPSDVRAAQFLGSVAAIEYGGAQPQRARQWVSETIARGGRITIGTVVFELSGPSAARTLEMRALKEP